MKKTLCNIVVAVMTIGMLAATSLDVNAQRLSAGERSVVRFLSDGTLSLAELTRAQQRRLVQPTYNLNDLRLTRADERLNDLIAANPDEVLAELSIDELTEVFDTFNRLFDLAELRFNILLYAHQEVLFEDPQTRSNGNTVSELNSIARSRARRAMFNRSVPREFRTQNVSVVFLQRNAADAAALLASTIIQTDADLIVTDPEALRDIVSFVVGIGGLDPPFGLENNVFEDADNLTLVAARAARRVTRFVARNF